MKFFATILMALGTITAKVASAAFGIYLACLSIPSLVMAAPVSVKTVGVIGEGHDLANLFQSGTDLSGKGFSMTTTFDPSLLPGQLSGETSRDSYCLSCSDNFSVSLTINGVTLGFVSDGASTYFSFSLSNGFGQNGLANLDRVANYVSGYVAGVPLFFSQTIESLDRSLGLNLDYDQSRLISPQLEDRWSTRFQYPSDDSAIYIFVGQTGSGIIGSISEYYLNPSPVSEPGTLSIFVLACAALGWNRRGFRSN
jgi:hypothetical protein